MSANEGVVLTMIADEVLPLVPYGLTLLKLENDNLSELRTEGLSLEEVFRWVDDLTALIFIYDASVYESYLVEKYLIDGDRLILFTFDGSTEWNTD